MLTISKRVIAITALQRLCAVYIDRRSYDHAIPGSWDSHGRKCIDMTHDTTCHSYVVCCELLHRYDVMQRKI